MKNAVSVMYSVASEAIKILATGMVAGFFALCTVMAYMEDKDKTESDSEG